MTAYKGRDTRKGKQKINKEDQGEWKDDDINLGCYNQQSFSGLLSPGRPCVNIFNNHNWSKLGLYSNESEQGCQSLYL